MSYGDIETLERYAAAPLKMPERFEWQHAWIPSPLPILSPESVVGSNGKSRYQSEQLYLVARNEQAAALRRSGYANVQAIGLPICYAAREQVPRQPNSLLLVPDHSTREIAASRNSFSDILEALPKFQAYFSKIGILIYASDLVPNVVDSLANAGIEILEGAQKEDTTSLDRIAQVFQRFETVHSLYFGSAIAYAALFGARISVARSIFDSLETTFSPAQHVFYRNCLPCAYSVREFNRQLSEHPEFQFLFREPHEAQPALEWAKRETGFDNRLTPEAVRSQFGTPQTDSGAYALHPPKSQLSRDHSPKAHTRVWRRIAWATIVARWLPRLLVSALVDSLRRNLRRDFGLRAVGNRCALPRLALLRATVAHVDSTTARGIRGLRLVTQIALENDFRREHRWLSSGYLVAFLGQQGRDTTVRDAFFNSLLDSFAHFPCETLEVGPLFLAWPRSQHPWITQTNISGRT